MINSSSFRIQKSLCTLLSLSLSSCQVSPKWGHHSQGVQGLVQTHAARPLVSGYQQPRVFTGQVYGGSPVIYQTASAMAQASRPTYPPVVQGASVFVPQVSPPAPLIRERGKVSLLNGRAVAPADAPPVVHRAVAAGNRLQSLPYKWGGGHAQLNDTGYDCSGAVSYVLREAGIMPDQRTSTGFLNYAEAGEGDWITVWAKEGHVFMIIGGLRLDTGGSTQRTGPRWKPGSRSYKGFIPRHPRGL